jgi:soluble lytic murein transglycosylase-like protein
MALCPKRRADPAPRLASGQLVLLLLGACLLGDANAGQFERAYVSQSAATLSNWGEKYEHGLGVPADTHRAIRLYCKAAGKGNVDAQYRLGWIYANGRGVRRDDALAAAWFNLAAKQDHEQSRNMLRLIRVKAKPRATCPLGTPTPSSRRSPTQSAARPEIVRLVRDLAPKYDLDPALVLAVIEVESGFNPVARSPKNAQGLMQLIPETAQRFGVRDVWDHEQNLRGGMAYLRWLLDYFKGDVRLALAGYNAGEASVLRHGGVPPYAETQDYVRRVAGKLDL